MGAAISTRAAYVLFSGNGATALVSSCGWRGRCPARDILKFFLPVIFSLFLVSAFFLFSSGVALADPVPTETPAAVSPFAEPPASELGTRWLAYLFAGQPLPEFRLELDIYQDALRALLGFYSKGMLILAGLILLFVLASTVTESAVHGQPFGKRANSVWMPIRVVLAIAVLIPAPNISGQGYGLNFGQQLIYETAKLSSSFASNGWNFFLQQVAQAAARPYDPGEPFDLEAQLRQRAINAVYVGACVATSLHVGLADDRPAPSEAAYVDLLRAVTDWHTNTYFAACADWVPWGDANLYRIETDFRRLGAILALSQLPGVRAEAIEALRTDGLIDDERAFEAALTNYFDAVRQKYITMQSSVTQPDRATTIGPLGWMMAGTYFIPLGRPFEVARLPHIRLRNIIGSNPVFDAYSRAWPQIAADLDRRFSNHSAPIMEAVVRQEAGRTSASVVNPPDDTLTGKISTFLIRTFVAKGIYEPGPYGEDSVAGSWMETLMRNNLMNPNDVISSLTSFGRRVVSGSFDSLWLGVFSAAGALGVGFSASALAGRLDFGTEAHRLNAVARSASVVFRNIGATAAGIILSVTFIFSFAGFIAGMMLAFFLPLLFFFRFTLGILAWLAAILESMIAIPLFALANLTPEGDGLAVQGARRLYVYILQMLLRPIMMILGLIITILLMNSLVGFLNFSMSLVTYSSNPLASDGFLKDFLWLIVYLVLVYTIFNMTVKVIDILPEQSVNWIGERGIDYGFDDQKIGEGVQAAATLMGKQTASGFKTAMQQSAGSTQQLLAVGGSWKGKAPAPPSGSAP